MDFGLSKETIYSICSVLKKYAEIEHVIIYGSRTLGTYKNGSDIDIVFKGPKLNLTILNKISNELDDLLLPYTFDLSIYHQIKNQDLIEHIDRVGVEFSLGA